MKKYILLILLSLVVFAEGFAQIGGVGGGAPGGTGGSGIGLGPNSNIMVNRNTSVLSGALLHQRGTPFKGDSTGGPEQERCVFWIHGMNGSGDSWSNAAYCSMVPKVTNFPARKLWSKFDFTYTQDSNMDNASASVLTNQIYPVMLSQQSQGINPSRNFLIGHSQGGIVARTMLKDNLCVLNLAPQAMGFGGLVTVCSPNQGAHLLGNKDKMIDMSNDLCNSLSAGPIEEFAQTEIRIRILGFQFRRQLGQLVNLPDLVDDVCSIFSDKLVKYVIGAYIPKTAKGYEVNSPHLNLLNSGCGENANLDSFPKVAFYGVEPESGLMLRNAQYFLTPPNEFEPFVANDDLTLINSFNENYKMYEAKVIEGQASLDHWLVKQKFCNDDPWYAFFHYNFCNNVVPKRIDQARKFIAAYQKGVKWFGRVDDQYKVIIGALKYNVVQQWYCECKQQDGPGFSLNEVSGPDAYCPPNAYWKCRLYQAPKYIAVKKASDGTVLAESAMNLPKATMNPVLLDNTSHMQARNNEAIRVALIDLYDGSRINGNFFKTGSK